MKPWTQDNGLLPGYDLGESAMWLLEVGPGPAPHCYLNISFRRNDDPGEGGGVMELWELLTGLQPTACWSTQPQVMLGPTQTGHHTPLPPPGAELS